MRSPSMVSILVALAVPGLAGAQDVGSGWQPMAYADFRTPSASDPLQALVWPDIIREANAYVTTELKRRLNGQNAFVTAISSTYQDGDRTIIVSTALTRQCESGANSKGAEIEPSTCPVRVATIQGERLLNMTSATACYVDHAHPDLPPRNRSDGTDSRFDPKAGTISLRTHVGGRDLSACARTLRVQ